MKRILYTCLIVAIVAILATIAASAQRDDLVRPLVKESWPEPPPTLTAKELEEVRRALPDVELITHTLSGPSTRGKLMPFSAGDVQLPADVEAGGIEISAYCRPSAEKKCPRTPILVIVADNGAMGGITADGYLIDERKRFEEVRIRKHDGVVFEKLPRFEAKAIEEAK